MATHFTIPLNRSPCSGGRYTAMPSGLSAYVSADAYGESMSRIQSANRSPMGARLLYTLSWVGYMLGLMQVCGLFSGYSADGYSYDNYYVNSTWLGLSVAVVSFISLIGLSRYMRRRRAVQVAAAVQIEHIAYSTSVPQLAWRVVDEGHIEVNVVVDQQQQVQHIAALEHQVHILQAQMAAQAHHQAVDHELIAHQAANHNAAHHASHHQPQPLYSPAHAHPHVQYYPSVPVAEPVYPAAAVYQPAPGSVFAHPPPQYYAASRNDMRAPLVRNQY